MENLNVEQIIKALECCRIGTASMCDNALALINSQEQRIKELTEENERLTNLCELRLQDNKNSCELLLKAEAENERLRADSV